MVQQYRDFADERLVSGCVYCGGPEETNEHVPSRVFLDQPYPENLPGVDACLGRRVAMKAWPLLDLAPSFVPAIIQS